MSLFLQCNLIAAHLHKAHGAKRNGVKTQHKMALLRGTLPCGWLVDTTSGLRDVTQPHLSPQHYELNAKQHVLDRTRVLVSRQ